MHYIQRIIPVAQLLEQKTVILWGPRQTGKSCFVREQLATAIAASYNLLDPGALRLRGVATNGVGDDKCGTARAVR